MHSRCALWCVLQRWLAFLDKYFVERDPVPPSSVPACTTAPAAAMAATITDLVVFPIKSCAGMRVQSWGCGDAGTHRLFFIPLVFLPCVLFCVCVFASRNVFDAACVWSVAAWSHLVCHGLLYDREWAAVDATGAALSQRKIRVCVPHSRRSTWLRACCVSLRRQWRRCVLH